MLLFRETFECEGRRRLPRPFYRRKMRGNYKETLIKTFIVPRLQSD